MMLWLCLALIPVAFAVALPATWVVRTLSVRAGMLDTPAMPGQLKAAARRVPNTGGVGIVLGFAVPIAAALAVLNSGVASAALVDRFPAIDLHLSGARSQTPAALTLLGGVLALHILGLIDDRWPLGPYLKLAVMLGVAGVVVKVTDSRLLTLLDARTGGPWVSIVITVLWIGVITNAFNFLDNMDGLSGGVAAICSAFFLVIALLLHQWFVAATFALLLGSVLGFLVFNLPRGPHGGATIFMGDGGSLVIGFLISLLCIRITYILPERAWQQFPLPGAATAPSFTTLASPWYSVCVPLIILAIPLYDFCSVCLIRLSQGRSPFVGDLQHFSHRLVNHGLSRRAAVLVIYGATAATGIGAVTLPSLAPWQAALVGAQTILILLVIALYEWSRPGEPGRPV